MSGPAGLGAPRLLLRHGVNADGQSCEVAVDRQRGVVIDVAAELIPAEADTVEDCTGLVILAAPAEPHAHLDKVLSADGDPRLATDDGSDLGAAIATWQAALPGLRGADVLHRALVAVETMVMHGTTAIRTHVGVGTDGGGRGLVALDALVELRAELRRRRLADLQIVAMVPSPATGPDAVATRRLIETVVASGADVVGGCPYRDPEPVATTALLLEAARQLGVPVDLHTDETLDPDVLTVADLARLVLDMGVGAGVTASHCVSLGMQEPPCQKNVAADLAAAGVSVVALPQTNLYLQARGVTTAPARGLTAVRPLLDAGVNVAGGADNVRDPFCRLGRLDAMETASLLVLAGHLSPAEAWAACTDGARRAMGLTPPAVAAGAPADLLCIEGTDLTTAMAGAGARRTVIRGGEVVARTTVARHLCC